MLDRMVAGLVPDKPHLFFRSDTGALRYEECLTRSGFDGAFSMLYHEHRPHEAQVISAEHGFRLPSGTPAKSLARRHFRCLELPEAAGAPIGCRVPLLYNADLVLGFLRPDRADPVYFANADADELFYILAGGGVLRSAFGDLDFTAGDYVCVPKGTIHRFVPNAELGQAWLSIECKGGLALPQHYRNSIGQLRMEAPYSHRDFRRPRFSGPLDEGIVEQVVKRGDTFFGFRHPRPPLDVVGWDGTVYPFAFPILAFQPRVGQVHLPPPVHTTFVARGAAICSFVPRPLDFHEQANPCPYPHSSVDVDEVLFYANGAFSSRRGIAEGSLSFHPAGIPHGPHPGAYESPPPERSTDEVAVMLDASSPLSMTVEASAIEDGEYHQAFIHP